MESDRFDPAKDATNREKHKLPLAFGDRTFEDDDPPIIASIREIDGEERFKVIGIVEGKLFTGVFVWRAALPRFISVRRSNAGDRESLSRCRLTRATSKISTRRPRRWIVPSAPA